MHNSLYRWKFEIRSGNDYVIDGGPLASSKSILCTLYGILSGYRSVFQRRKTIDPSWMDQPVPRHYFDVNKRIEQLRSYMDREMHRNQIDDIQATIRLYEEGVLEGIWGTNVIIQNGAIVPLESLQLDKPYWIEVSLGLMR